MSLKHYPRGLIIPPVQIWPREDSVDIIKVESYEINYLTAPFEHNCVNYTEIGLESDGHCFEKCVDAHWLKHNPDYTAIHMSFKMEELADPVHRNRRAVKALPNYKLNHDCEKKCNVDCNTKTYLINKTPGLGQFGKGWEMMFESPGIKMVVNYVGNLPLYQYLLLLSSVITFWFPLSIYSVGMASTKIFIIIKAFKNIFDQRLNRNAWMVIGTLGLFVHLVYVTKQYMDYETMSEVASEYESNFKVPDDSFCFEVSALLKKEKVAANSSCVFSKDPKKPDQTSTNRSM